MFIVSLVISFGLGIVTGPLAFIAIIPGYISFIKESLAGKTPSPEAIFALLSSMSWAIGITMLISGVVRGALWPSFLTMLHADLRIRAGEQAPWAEETTGDTALEAGGAVFEAGDPAHGEAEGGELV
jgi:hypothetical protein